jgi:mono/diheme cytochrome c family protein
MSFRKKIALPIALALTFGVFAGAVAQADDHEGREKSRHGSRSASSMKTPENALYKQECSSCHFLYQSWLLPARSWQAIMDESDKHFGENLALDAETSKELRAYLKANSSDKTDTRWAQRITTSSEGITPKRIMDVPWIKKEHREVGASVFKRPSIGSSSNCGACHTKGAEGNFDEDYIKIPRQ